MSTIASYVGDGATRQFSITFTYRSTDTIFVRVDGVDVPFTLISSSLVEVATAPATGALVEVYRNTATDPAAVVFQDGQVIHAEDLNDAVAQARDRTEELSSETIELRQRALRVPAGETALPMASLSGAEGKALGIVDGKIVPVLHDGTGAAVAELFAGQAASSAASAQSSKDAAEAAKTAAEGAKSGADTAKAGAEAARDAANINARVYATTAAGLAATTDGQYFNVPSANATEHMILYLNSAGSAVEQKRYPAADLVKNLAAPSVTGVEYAVQDSNDNASEYIDASGTHLFTGIDADTINGIPRYRLKKATRSSCKFNASIVHHISYGQSLSLGNGSLDVHTLPNVDDGFFDSVMFNASSSTYAGPRAQEGTGTVAENHASFVAYEERPLTGNSPTGNLETPLGNSLRTVKRLLRDEDGVKPTDFDYILLGSAPGQSNTAISGLSKGSAPYANLINDVTYGLANSQTAGKSYCVDVVYWSQGERDIQLNTARTTYKNALLQLYTDLNTDIKAITGQSHDIKIIMYQCTMDGQFTTGQAGANIALAQLDAARANSNIILATNVYAMEHVAAGNAHLSAAGYAHLGGYYGLAAKRVVVDGSSWANLAPIRVTRQGKIVEIEFPDTGYPLAASNTLFASQTNYGLTAVQSDGVTDNPIVSAAVVGPRRVRVVLTNAVGGFIRYGFASWGGNLHDTCDVEAGTARNHPLYRPVLSFDEAFA